MLDTDVYEFEKLLEAIQVTFEQTNDDEDFETDGATRHELEESPKLLDTDRYAQYMAFEDEYNWVEVEVNSG